MLTVSVDALKDYRVCELFYDYRHLKNEPEPISGRDLLTSRFENTLKRVVSFFFYKKQGLATPSYNALLNRWEKLWFPKGTDAYELTTEQHESAHGNLASYSTAAAAALLQFHEDFANMKAEPILIDEKFLIPLGENLRLEGTIDLLLRSNGRYKVVKWSARQKRPTAASLTLDFAVQKLAFNYRNDDTRKAAYSLYDLASTRPGFVPFHPSEDDVNALLYWAKNMRDSEVFVPRRGFTVYCKSCPFDELCAKFSFPEVEV